MTRPLPSRHAFVLAFALCGGCSGNANDCDDGARLARFGVQVSVIDATGARVCDAQVDTVGSEHREVLLPQGTASDCFYAGLVQQPGVFTITASKPGFRNAETTVRVRLDECQKAVTEQVQLELAPGPA